MRAYIKYKAYCDKKVNASKHKERNYTYVLKLKADKQGSKIPSTDFIGLGPILLNKLCQKIVTWYARL